MHRTLALQRNVIYFGIPLALLCLLVGLMNSSLLQSNSGLSAAITADLLFTVPLVYFLLIRKTDIPKITVIPVMVLGVVVGSNFLPTESQTHLELFKTYGLPLIELSVLGLIVFKVRKGILAYRGLKGNAPDFYDTLKQTCAQVLPKKLVNAFATEIAVFYYGFVRWKKPVPTANVFTYHQRSGSSTLWGALLMIILIETFALHFLLATWSPTVAWVLTVLSSYTAIQFLAFSKSLAQRPHELGANQLILRYGILKETAIDFENIEHIELARTGIKDDPMHRRLSALGELETYNVILRLKKAQVMHGLYGIQRTYNTLALHVDDPQAFQASVDQRIVAC